MSFKIGDLVEVISVANPCYASDVGRVITVSAVGVQGKTAEGPYTGVLCEPACFTASKLRTVWRHEQLRRIDPKSDFTAADESLWDLCEWKPPVREKVT